MQIQYQEKWLTRISVNSSLDAFGFGLAKFSEMLDQLLNKKLIVILKVILETNAGYPDKSLHIQQFLDKILPLDDSLTILSKNFLKSGGKSSILLYFIINICMYVFLNIISKQNRGCVIKVYVLILSSVSWHMTVLLYAYGK